MKDPLLATYTLEELVYEFHSTREHKKALAEQAEEQNDKIEEEKDKEAQEWADMMEAEEEGEHEDPSKDPDNVNWMEEQIAKDKELYGEDYGENLDLNFNSPAINTEEDE